MGPQRPPRSAASRHRGRRRRGVGDGVRRRGAALLVAGTDTDLEVWDVTDPLAPRRSGGTPPGGGHEHVALAPDGALLTTVDDDGGAVLWDLSDRNRPRQLRPASRGLRGCGADAVEIAQIPRPRGAVADRGGEGLAVATERAREDLRAAACAIAGGGLTPDEWTRYVSGLDHVDSCAG